MRALLFPLAVLASPVLAMAGDCDVPLGAALKMNDIPYRMTTISASGSEVGHMVATADRMYVEVGGAWHAMDREKDVTEDLQAEVAAGHVQCAELRREALGGVATTVYEIRQTGEDEVPDQTVWIGDDSGLMLRAEFAGGDDEGSGAIASAEFSYDDVTAPAGAE